MIRFDDFFKMNNVNAVKIKLNMNPGDSSFRALDFLLDDSPRWTEMTSWKAKAAQNNYGNAQYVLAFAQYYPYGKEFYLFGGLYKIEKKMPEIFGGEGYILTLQNDYIEYHPRSKK